jgi:L-threonylcarbamoyladenylate synthase
MEILKINPGKFRGEDLQPAAAVLKRGGLVAYPTETVYGLGANIFHRQAVAKIAALKGRDPRKPVSIMISGAADVEQLCRDISPLGRTLMAAYWPGPLTLIFKASQSLPRYVITQDGKIGLRVPDHPICAALMRLHREPVTSTSANLTGEPPLISARHIVEQFGEKLALVIDGGECRSGAPSTVVDVSGAKPMILREGAIAAAEVMRHFREVPA